MLGPQPNCRGVPVRQIWARPPAHTHESPSATTTSPPQSTHSPRAPPSPHETLHPAGGTLQETTQASPSDPTRPSATPSNPATSPSSVRVAKRSAAWRAAQDSRRTRVWTMSPIGRWFVARCNRRSAVSGEAGSATMTAPASGPEPVAVRTTPIASSTRTASRTDGRLIPSCSARDRSPGAAHPAATAPPPDPPRLGSNTSS